MTGVTTTGHREATLDVLAGEVHPLGGLANDYDPLLDLIGLGCIAERLVEEIGEAAQ